jgi:hypothetical protein
MFFRHPVGCLFFGFFPKGKLERFAFFTFRADFHGGTLAQVAVLGTMTKLSPVNSPAAIPFLRSHVPTIAGFGLPYSNLARFQDSFASLNMSTQTVLWRDEMDIDQVRCDAFVVRLNSHAREFLASIRKSKLNRAAFVYGIGEERTAIKSCRYAINSVLPDCSQESIAKAVEKSHLLLSKQLRKFARIPLVIPVRLSCGNKAIISTTRDLTATGLSVELRGQEWDESHSEVSFVLPEAPIFRLESAVMWKVDQTVGLEFSATKDQQRLKEWVDEYLRVQ